MREKWGIESGVLSEEGGQRLIRGVRNHDEKHYACVPVGEFPNLELGGGGLTEGGRYAVYPRNLGGEPSENDSQGVYVHVHCENIATLEQLYMQARTLGYSSSSEGIITDPPKDKNGAIGYLVKVAESPMPAWKTETWERDDGQEEQDEQEAADAFLHFIQRM